MLAPNPVRSASQVDWFPCPNVGEASTNRDLRHKPRGLFFFYCDKFTPFSHLKSRMFSTGL